MLTRRIRALLMLGIAGWLAGCGGGGDEPPPEVSAPTITVQPASPRVTAPGAAGFDVTTSGSAGTYQWQLCTDANPTCVSWSDIVGATAASYSTGVTDAAMTGRRFRVLASNSRGNVTSSTVTLTVDPTRVAPVITGQPADASVVAPALASFTVAFSGVPTPMPQWQYPNDGSTWFDLGVSDATYSTGPMSTSDSGRHFRVIVNGISGNVTSSAVILPVAPAAVAPSITARPASQTVSAPAAATFSVAASGTPAPTLQWQLSSDGGSSWTDIAGATAASYTTPATSVGNSGVQYRAVAANGAGAANSHAATLTVNAAPLPASNWQTASLIETDNLGEAVGPQVAFNAVGDGMAVWYQSDGTNYNIWANRSVAGTGWGTAVQIGSGNSNVNHVTPQIAVDAAGNAFAVWPQYNGSITNIWGNRFVTGTGRGTAALIQTDTASSGRDPRIAAEVNGNAMVAWAQFDGVTSIDHIWANRYVAGMGWATAALIQTNNATHQANLPKIAFYAAGNAIAAWNQGAFGSYGIYAARYGAGTGWGAETLVETHAAGSGAANVGLGVDTSGNAIVVWQRRNPARFDISANAYR